MGAPVKDKAIGTPDGVLLDFETQFDYIAGTLRVWLNGQLKLAVNDDGFTETGANTFQMKEAPRPTDVLFTLYEAQ